MIAKKIINVVLGVSVEILYAACILGAAFLICLVAFLKR